MDDKLVDVMTTDGRRYNHFGLTHPLARVARRRCDSEHRLAGAALVGGVACGACWERTIRDDERIVVDSGLARRPRYDRAAGVTRLVTERASQAAVTQRAGRAARQAPGRVYRLWEEAAAQSLPRFDPPEILEA